MRIPQRTQEEQFDEWINSNPERESAVSYLIRGILRKTLTQDQIELVADYINEFDEGFDPVGWGWVGSDGLP